jgi:hypothetical protein
MKIDIEDIQNNDDPYWYNNLKGMLGMLDQIIRLYGNDEEKLKEMAGNFIWKLTQFNLPFDTEARHENEFERCGTFPKWAGKPSISHLIAEAYPRETSQTRLWDKQRQSVQVVDEDSVLED